VKLFAKLRWDNLLGVVLVEGHPYTVLKKAQLVYVREQLMERLEKSIDSGTTIPQFQELELCHCRFHLSCTNMQTYQWLQEAVASIWIAGICGISNLQNKVKL